ncbi:MAG: hypothetical protein CME16_06170, partial [Gemmatimonadetes bacterium]|nr:hypothetical protein [Gemmatimonadota bacterium]
MTYERAYASLLPGDFNADGTVNFIDFFMFSDVFNQPVTAANRKYDLAQDGAIIDFLDFFVFADNFNRTLAFAAHIQAVGFAEVNPAISGMAPFTVHVNALTSTFSAGNETASDISWDFGDSSESSDYNEIQGFNASHTYNEPGSYTLLLTIVTPESETVQRSVSVTIEEDTRSRIYLSSSGDDANTGMSKADPVRTLPRAAELATDNCWILFKRGEVFEDTDATLALIGLENVRVSTYGEGARPILTGGLESNEANPSHISFHQVTDLIIEDLEFTGPTDPAYLSADWYKGVSATDSESVNVTIRNNHFDNVGFSIVIVPTPGTESGSAGLLVQDNTTDLVGRYLIYSDLQNATIVGNEVLGTVEGHPIRIYGGPYNISFNQFDTDKERLAFEEQQEHAVGFSVNLVTGSHFYIGYNKIFAGNMIGYLTQFGISSVQNVVFEGNEFARCCHTWITTLRIFPACDNIVIKNNVFAGNQDAIRLEEAGAGVEGFSNRVRNVDVLFNTVYNPTPDGRF